MHSTKPDIQTQTGLAIPETIEINPPQSRPAEVAERVPGRAFLCRHIFVDGRQCGAHALRGENFCFYHRVHRTPVLANTRRRKSGSGFDLNRLDGLDNHTAIQLSLAEILARIANRTIDPKSAGLLLYGLQIAGHNLRHARPLPEAPIPETIVEDGVLGQLAELEEGRIEPPSLFSRMQALLKENPDADLSRLADGTEDHT